MIRNKKFKYRYTHFIWRFTLGATLFASPSLSFANYECSGLVAYLGINSGGDLVIQLLNSTPIHNICNVNTQGSYQMSVASCKITYSSLLAAKMTSRPVNIFYNDNLTCSNLPSWGAVNSVYFVEGPD